MSTRAKASEATVGQLIQTTDGSAANPGVTVPVAVAPTLVRHPRRAAFRSAVRAAIAVAVLFPILVESAGLPPRAAGYFAIPVAVCAALARIMALPQVEVFLREHASWLSATGRQ